MEKTCEEYQSMVKDTSKEKCNSIKQTADHCFTAVRLSKRNEARTTSDKENQCGKQLTQVHVENNL